MPEVRKAVLSFLSSSIRGWFEMVDAVSDSHSTVFSLAKTGSE